MVSSHFSITNVLISNCWNSNLKTRFKLSSQQSTQLSVNQPYMDTLTHERELQLYPQSPNSTILTDPTAGVF